VGARDRELQRIEAELRASADPRIDVFIRDLEAEIDAICLEGPTIRKSAPDPLTDSVKTFSNHRSQLARLQALRNARAAAGVMKLEALTVEEIEARLGALRAGFPAVEIERVSAA
jgi:hypothetical protein